MSFIRDLIKDATVKALGEVCFDGAQRHRANIRTAFVDGPAVLGDVDPIQNRYLEDLSSLEDSEYTDSSPGGTVRLDLNKYSYEKPVFPYAGTQAAHDMSFKKYWQYIVIYAEGPSGLWHPKAASNTRCPPHQTAQECDRERGIYHLHIGRDRGLVKRIQFQKQNAPGLREARVERMGSFDPIQQLSDVYNINVEMFGNTLFWPGSYIYINPFGLATEGELGMPWQPNSISNIMGLGGYHIVTGVESFIEAGKFETIIRARWESSGDGFHLSSARRDTLVGSQPDSPATKT